MQAEPQRRHCATFCTVRRPTARAEHGNQCLASLATDDAIGLHRAHVYRAGIALVSLWSLWPLRAFSASRSLRAWHTLNALGALRARGALRPWVALWTRFAATCSQSQSHPKG